MAGLMPYREVPWNIAGVVQKALHQWKRTNTIRETIPFSRWEAILLEMGERPWVTCICFAAWAVLLWLIGPATVRHFIVPPGLIWDPGSQISYFGTLWSVQATLAALVFPIVIAFVTVFLQRRPSAEGLVHLYLLTSGGTISGLLSIALIIVMAVQYAFADAVDVVTLKRWAAVDTVWFGVNAAMTAVFLYRTMEFLRPQAQLRAVIRYAVHVALPREIEGALQKQMLWSTHVHRWIPNTDTPDDKSTTPKVELQDFLGEHGEVQLSTSFRGTRQLIDVRLWLLRAAVSSWLRRARTHVVPEANRGFGSRAPCLALVARIGEIRTGTKSTVVVRGGPTLSTLERGLMRAALVWRRVPPIRGVALRDLLAELQEDARQAATQADYEAFKKPYDSFVDLHENLLAASLFKDEAGTPDSWAVLTDPSGWMEQRFHRNWALGYRRIFEACVEAAHKNSGPFERVCHLPRHISGDAVKNSPTEVSEQVLMLPGLLRHLLSQWWVRNVAANHPNHGPNTPAMLAPPLDSLYESMLRSFIAGWEDSRDALADIPDAAEMNWGSAPHIAQVYGFHLEKTASMLLASAAIGDIAAVRWFADALTKWWGMLDHDNDLAHYEDETRFVTHESLANSWELVADEIGLNAENMDWRGGTKRAQRAVLLAALRNHWTDVRWITVEMLLAWSASESSNTLTESPSLECAAGLLSGRLWKSGGTASDELSSHGAADYVQAKVRQYGSPWRKSVYRSRLDRFIENAAGARAEPMVSGRIYSLRGATDLDSLQHAQVLLLASISKSDWQTRPQTLQKLTDWVEHDYWAAARVRRWADEFLKVQLADQWRSVLAEMLSRSSPELSAEQALARAARGAASVRSHVDVERFEALRVAPIAAGRLEEIAGYASSEAFSSKDGDFPLGLFAEVRRTMEVLKPFTLHVRSNKGELTEQEFSQRVSNEGGYWTHLLREYVAWVVLQDVIDQLAPQKVQTTSEDQYWAQLEAVAADLRNAGKQPVLILENPTLPRWVREWRHSRAGNSSAGKRISREENMPNGYEFTVNGIRVFSCRGLSECSLLTAQESFERLEFTRSASGRFVEVEAKPIDNDVEHVTLEATFRRVVHLGHIAAVLLQYGDATGDDVAAVVKTSE